MCFAMHKLVLKSCVFFLEKVVHYCCAAALEAVVIQEFHAKASLRRMLRSEKVLSNCSTCGFDLLMDIFRHPPVLFIEYTSKLLILYRGLQSPLFLYTPVPNI
jgi:hypothetical protein